MDWITFGIVLSVLTAMVMAFGFWLEARRPNLHVAVLIVGFLWGIVVGAIMWLAFRLGGDRPGQRGLIYGVAIAAGVGSMLAISYLVIGPSVPVGSSLGTGRIERPATGYAVTFPGSMSVSEATQATTDYLYRELDPELRAHYRVDIYVLEDAIAECSVLDFSRLAPLPPAWTTLDDATEGFFAGLRADEGLREQEVAYETVAAGRAGHISATHGDGGAYDAWIFVQDGTWLKIECNAVTRPSDGWRSVAESLEWRSVPGS